MKRKPIIAVVSSLVLIVLMVGPVVAQDFYMDSHAELDTSFQGKIPEKLVINTLTKEEAEKYPFLWWRDTTRQNQLWDHTNSNFSGDLLNVYDDGFVKVFVWNSKLGSNVVAIEGPTGAIVIGGGGSQGAALAASGNFSAAIPSFASKVKAIIMTDSNFSTVWGTKVFRANSPTAGIFASAEFLSAATRTQRVHDAERHVRIKTMGIELESGPNGNLGIGSGFRFDTSGIGETIAAPTVNLSEDTTVNPCGFDLTLIPTNEEDGGLMVFLPAQKILIIGEIFGKYFPPVGALTGPDIPALGWIATLNRMKNMSADMLVSLHAMPIVGAGNVQSALIAQRDALSYVHSQTVNRINVGQTLDDIVASVTLPPILANNPYVGEYTSTVPNAVRGIYHQYMGWFDGDIDSLNNLSDTDQAEFIVQLAGGAEKALQTARTYEQDHTMAGVQKAIFILEALRLASPSTEADKIYAQALRKMGYAQTSGQMRNYYLTEAKRVEASLP